MWRESSDYSSSASLFISLFSGILLLCNLHSPEQPLSLPLYLFHFCGTAWYGKPHFSIPLSEAITRKKLLNIANTATLSQSTQLVAHNNGRRKQIHRATVTYVKEVGESNGGKLREDGGVLSGSNISGSYLETL